MPASKKLDEILYRVGSENFSFGLSSWKRTWFTQQWIPLAFLYRPIIVKENEIQNTYKILNLPRLLWIICIR